MGTKRKWEVLGGDSIWPNNYSMTTEYKKSLYYTKIQNRFYRCLKLKGHILKIRFLLVYVL